MILLHTRDDAMLLGANPNHLRNSYPSTGSGDDPYNNTTAAYSAILTTESSVLDDDAIWIPPEAADVEDEGMTDHHHAAPDDDDDEDSDYDDGTVSWCQQQQPSSSFSTTAISYREERQKAMLRAMNGQLKMLAARFLESAGIPASHHQRGGAETTTCWLDIVTSLSWEAALLIRPDGTAGKEMDPSTYIKVKCLASGTRRQCEVIRGLVFKKNAAHKHMPTRCHNPRLLLLRGFLGDSDIGFSSFRSIEQEKDHLEKSVCKMMEICRPNVIMVEKTVSRDIQELLLKEEVLSKPKLKQCDYFHIEKVTEEHSQAILLRGANSEELKKVKQVMHYTVFAAYHLVLETSFFEDQRVILNNKNASKEEISLSTLKLYPLTYNGPVEESTDGETVTISSTKTKDLNSLEKGFPNELTEEATDHQKEDRLQYSQDMAGIVSGKHEQPSTPLENGEHQSISYISGDKTSDIDEVICEQSHLSRIKYYGNFDVSLGRYLQDILQNQNLSCSSCGEPPEAHISSRRVLMLGSKVAMFQYSSVEIYTACKPQPTLEFHNPNTHEWYGQEVLARGVMLFSEVTGLLQDLKDQFSEVAIYCGAFLPIKEFSQLEDMLIKEKSEFMCTLAQAVERSGAPSSVHEILNGTSEFTGKFSEPGMDTTSNELLARSMSPKQEPHKQSAEEVGSPQFTVGPDSEASISSEDLSTYDSSLLSSSLHPEISVNGRVALKGKYSKWDAQGGKSKAFFAKTVDDSECPVLFQVKQIRHGKEIKMDLMSINVMDYSLLVGVDKQKHELVFGIIDYLRQYTWDKQLETWVKTSLVMPKNESPTVISPREYKKRFRKFMSKYFLTVPDDWSTENRPVSCKSCAHAAGSIKLNPNPNPLVACA
ncbi:putative 1-phosphatidylinositol-3-phosphate 5-kinase FAB1D [Dichanthelium oligosanthes]|uniref:Putative 1-phosphatidylinositol-3-phosphate 5-kinase FAB1D n=1 Tax=Dichanthelium oligosanthes TaxID=888268 RepID=A0A1E5V540_9POAL|nr:putative 1-phosphatidylinositol-3-phosphate 5-kinase FAB1D [Dichanthelium oligosanthes]